ncbi:MAG: hypothetical protein RIB60_03045 [Phycisphaerales bacterium]
MLQQANVVLTTAPSAGFPVSSLGLFAGGGFGGTPVALGSSVTLTPVNTDFASPVTVTFEADTVGSTRTARVTFETSGDAFVTQDAIDSVLTPDVVWTGLTFNLGFDDDEWDGGTVTQTVSFFEGATELTSFQNTPSGIFISANGRQSNSATPVEAGFYGGSGVADTYVFERTYGVVPAPGTALAFIVAGLGASSRRRA